MHAIDTSGADAGKFKETPGPATKVSAEWANDIQENLLGVLALFGIDPVKGDWTQLADVFVSFGVPGRKAVTDLDALAVSGFFASSDTATGRPAGVAGGLVVSLFDAAGSADGAQIFVEKTANRIWLRRWTGAAWQAWAAVAGDLTGSSGTGRWRKHPDGEIEQHGYFAGGSANPFITFPLEFPTACEHVQVTAVSTTNETPTSTQGGVKYASPAAIASTAGFSVWCSADDGGPDTFQPSTSVPFYWSARGR